MATIAENLTKLDQLRKDLATNINNKGVAADQTEKLSTLVPKVAEITNYDSGLKLQTKTVNPVGNHEHPKNGPKYQHISADNGYDGLSKVIINPITSDIDPNIIPENIAWGYTILGVTGTYMCKISAALTTTWGRPGSIVNILMYLAAGDACNRYDVIINFNSSLTCTSVRGENVDSVIYNINNVKINRPMGMYHKDSEFVEPEGCTDYSITSNIGLSCLELSFKIPDDATSGTVYNIGFDKGSTHFYNGDISFDIFCLAPGKITVI